MKDSHKSLNMTNAYRSVIFFPVTSTL